MTEPDITEFYGNECSVCQFGLDVHGPHSV